MNNTGDQPRKQATGVSIHAIMWPIVAILVIMLIGIIFTIIAINRDNEKLSETMRKSDQCISEATSLLVESGTLSETASAYILMPLTEEGELNFGPLTRYTAELSSDKTPDKILERFRKYDVDSDVVNDLTTAADNANQMIELQLHAIALMNEVYPLPDIPPLAGLQIPELTEEEKALPDEEKVKASQMLILGSKYAINKRFVSENVGACTEKLQYISAHAIEEATEHIMTLRRMLWIVTSTVIAILILTFFFFYKTMISPISEFTKLIMTDSPMSEEKGVMEVRLVAAAYNSLLRRKDALNNLFRYAAETDTLTRLPNRYGFEQYLLDTEENNCSVTVLMFDVNFLKETNDTYGHSAGDKLLVDTAACITECFATDEGNNCFRFGGDEFASVIREATLSEIETMVQKFAELQLSYHISVAFGYAFAESVNAISIRELIDEADKKMYERKRLMHKERSVAGG